MLTPFWQVPFHAFSELAGTGFLDLRCDEAGEPDPIAGHAMPIRDDAVRGGAGPVVTNGD